MLPKWFHVGTIVLVAIFSSTATAYVDYKNYRIYNIVSRTEADQQFLLELSRDRSLDFFDLGRMLNDSSTVLVPPQRVRAFEEVLRGQRIQFECVVDDLSVVVAEEHQRNAPKNALNSSNIYERYYRHHEINDYLESLARMYPSRLFLKTFGRTYEGRSMKVLTITNGDGRTGKKVIYVDATMHAREWIAPAMALNIINELVENHAENAPLLLDYDWVVLPVVNADGYEYSHEVERFWRKTRKPNSGNNSAGTDPNRNFDYAWGRDVGSSANPNDETYRGDKPFSEPETRVVRDIMRTYGQRLKYYLSLHTFGKYILLPWGFQSGPPETYSKLMEVAEAGAEAIKSATGTIYKYGNTFSVLYPTSGDSADYAHGAAGIPITMIMELPRDGTTGFNPPASCIEEFVTETWFGIRAMAKVVVETY